MNFKPLMFSALNVESLDYIHRVSKIRELNDEQLKMQYLLADIIVGLNNCLYRKFVPQNLKSLLLK